MSNWREWNWAMIIFLSPLAVLVLGIALVVLAMLWKFAITASLGDWLIGIFSIWLSLIFAWAFVGGNFR